jgi:hypothetical protein
MMILSVILAEDNPLHLAVICRNVDQITQYIEDTNVYDEAGRNPLHQATYIEPRCVDRKSCFIEVYDQKLASDSTGLSGGFSGQRAWVRKWAPGNLFELV